MKVEVRSKEVVRPSSPTPQSLKNYKLSFMDQLALNVKLPFVFFYDSSGAYSHDRHTNTIDELKESLSKTLSLMYPLAGRVKEDKVTIECNDEGVEFIVADVDENMCYLLDNPEMEKIKQMIIPTGTVNRFSCGGIAIGFFVSHAIADGSAVATLFETWASINRGYAMNGNGFVSDQSSILFPPLTYTSAIERSVEMAAEAIRQEEKNMVVKRFVIPAHAIAQLREELICKENNKGSLQLIDKENNKGSLQREDLICKENNKGSLQREDLICKENNKGSLQPEKLICKKNNKGSLQRENLICKENNKGSLQHEDLICKENNKESLPREELICKENNKGSLPRPSRTEAITALVWAAVINATPPTQTVPLSCMVNVRSRMEPPLPPNCLGCMTYGATVHWEEEAAAKGGTVTALQLVQRIRDSLRAVNDAAARKMYGEGGLLRAAFARGHEMVRNKGCSTTLYTSSLCCVDNLITKLISGGESQDWW
nr:vinorine synthase-like [Ipomoea batatas]